MIIDITGRDDHKELLEMITKLNSVIRLLKEENAMLKSPSNTVTFSFNGNDWNGNNFTNNTFNNDDDSGILYVTNTVDNTAKRLKREAKVMADKYGLDVADCRLPSVQCISSNLIVIGGGDQV